MDDLLRAWRMGVEEATSYGRELAAGTDAEPDELFDLFQQAFSMADEAMVSTATGHRRDSREDDEGQREHETPHPPDVGTRGTRPEAVRLGRAMRACAAATRRWRRPG